MACSTCRAINATLHPSLTLDATSESVGDNVPWADGNPPRLELRWNSDPAERMLPDDHASSTARSPPRPSIGITGTPAGGAAGTASLTMNPSPQCKTLTVAKTGTGTGSVSGSPPGITCGATCTSRYLSGTTVTLTATPTAGSTFTGWSGGGCSGTSTCVVALTADTTVTANFELLRTLTVAKTGSGTGSVWELACRHHVRRDLQRELRQRHCRDPHGHPRCGLGLHRLERQRLLGHSAPVSSPSLRTRRSTANFKRSAP